MIKKLLILLTLSTILCGYEFKGTHYIGDYYKCNKEVLSNPIVVFSGLFCAAQEAGATIIKTAGHIFPGDGCTVCLVLSESHATIHTYPEFGACFVDFFTCGDSTDFEVFHKFLKTYLGSQQSIIQVFNRGLASRK